MQKEHKDMVKELERYKDRVFFLNKIGGLMRIHIETLSDYNHQMCELHHFIPYNKYIGNEQWYKEHGIKQKLILVSKRLHEDIEMRGITQLTDSQFERKYKISRWKLVFNKRHSIY